MAEVANETLVDGRYRITDRIGSGGMADVYCADDEQLGREVALKILHRRFAQDEEFVERFRREASAAAGLQPHNVIVGEDDSVKVTDFGIARAGASEMTETGSIMGTAQYLSPEQAQGQRVGAQSDLYSIGVMLYEMLSGRVPFGGDSAVSIALKHVSDAPPRLRDLRPDVHPRLEQAG